MFAYFGLNQLIELSPQALIHFCYRRLHVEFQKSSQHFQVPIL